jgi:hypothetical protein
MWSNFLSTFEGLLGKYCPAPKTSADKQECIAIQHFLYIMFVLLESIDSGEVTIVKNVVEATEASEVITTWYIKHEDDLIAIAPTREFILYLSDLFGIKNIGIPISITKEQYENIVNPLKSDDDVPLAEMETHIEQWISDNLDNDWNIYLELAESGELSVESQAILQRIQRRISALGHKTFRRIDDNEESPATKKGIHIQKYTRKSLKKSGSADNA